MYIITEHSFGFIKIIYKLKKSRNKMNKINKDNSFYDEIKRDELF